MLPILAVPRVQFADLHLREYWGLTYADAMLTALLDAAPSVSVYGVLPQDR